MTDREIISVHAAARRRSWEDSTDDASRLVLERACDAISELKRRLKERDARLVTQAAALERAEHVAEVMHRAAFGGQKGGAA